MKTETCNINETIPGALRLQVKWMSDFSSDAWTFKHKTRKARENNLKKFFPEFKLIYQL